MKQLQLFLIILLSIIAINCKNPAKTNPTETEKPLTLSDRAGTYAFENKGVSIYYYITVKKDGTGIYTGHNREPNYITIGDPSSTNTSFTFELSPDSITIDFEKGTLSDRYNGEWTLVK